MIDNYEDLNQDETLTAVRDFDGEKLKQFIEFERENKNRKTVYKPLKRELVVVTPADQRYAGGLWFDDADEVRTVRRSRRVDEAIDEGVLEVV